MVNKLVTITNLIFKMVHITSPTISLQAHTANRFYPVSQPLFLKMLTVSRARFAQV